MHTVTYVCVARQTPLRQANSALPHVPASSAQLREGRVRIGVEAPWARHTRRPRRGPAQHKDPLEVADGMQPVDDREDGAGPPLGVDDVLHESCGLLVDTGGARRILGLVSWPPWPPVKSEQRPGLEQYIASNMRRERRRRVPSMERSDAYLLIASSSTTSLLSRQSALASRAATQRQ
jgi:hypothetical protein